MFSITACFYFLWTWRHWYQYWSICSIRARKWIAACTSTLLIININADYICRQHLTFAVSLKLCHWIILYGENLVSFLWIFLASTFDKVSVWKSEDQRQHIRTYMRKIPGWYNYNIQISTNNNILAPQKEIGVVSQLIYLLCP